MRKSNHGPDRKICRGLNTFSGKIRLISGRAENGAAAEYALMKNSLKKTGKDLFCGGFPNVKNNREPQ